MTVQEKKKLMLFNEALGKCFWLNPPGDVVFERVCIRSVPFTAKVYLFIL